MATTTLAPKSVLSLSTLTAPFRAIGRGLVALAESGPRMAAIRKLNETSDEELAARGTTRMDEVNRIFSGSLSI